MGDSVKLIKIIHFEVFTPITRPRASPITNLYDGRAAAHANVAPPPVTDAITGFPVILCGGIPWDHSTRYLLERAQSFDAPQAQTLVGIGRDLRDFKQWVDDKAIDYLSCDKKISSPVRKYRRFLSTTTLSAPVVSRKLGRVVAFYRWLQDSEKVMFKASLWEDKEAHILMRKASGQNMVKTIKTTDVQTVRGSRSTNSEGFDGVIQDGGKLTPLTPKQQQALFSCLAEIGNIEMTLSFMIALATGARLQTVFTLRQIHFSYEPRPDQKEVIIYAGSWSPIQVKPVNDLGSQFAGDIDTKNGKQIKIHFPVWLYKRIQIYITSERAKRRYSDPKHFFPDRPRQYLFLTTRRQPFYSAKNDDVTDTYLNPPMGASVQQFVSSQLKPLLNRCGYTEHFKFHNLRASYGMNLVRKLLALVGKPGQLSVGEIFSLVRIRMAHSRIETTQLYLDFDQKQTVVKAAQQGYEENLQEMLADSEIEA